MRKLVRALAWIGGIFAVICGIVYALWLDVWVIPSDDPREAISLEPMMHPGDVLLVARGTGGRFGFMMRCPDPDAPGRYVLGRLMGQSQQTVVIDGEAVSVDNRRNALPASCTNAPAKMMIVNPANQQEVELHCTLEETGSSWHEVLLASQSAEPHVEQTVATGRVYLVSDNRHFHLDSRDFGQLDASTCQHVVFRLWSGQGWSDGPGRLTLLY